MFRQLLVVGAGEDVGVVLLLQPLGQQWTRRHLRHVVAVLTTCKWSQSHLYITCLFYYWSHMYYCLHGIFFSYLFINIPFVYPLLIFFLTYIHAYMHTCIHAYMHTCIHAYMHTCIHAYMHTCIHAYMHTCIHAHTHTRTQTYIHQDVSSKTR